MAGLLYDRGFATITLTRVLLALALYRRIHAALGQVLDASCISAR